MAGLLLLLAAAEQPFPQNKQAALARMMQAMDVAPTGSIDRNFVAMMVPHHQGAIDMATALLRHGGNGRLHRRPMVPDRSAIR